MRARRPGMVYRYEFAVSLAPIAGAFSIQDSGDATFTYVVLASTDIVIFALAIVVFAFVSDRARRGFFTAPMMFAGLGLLVGPLVLGWADLDFENGAIDLLAELTLVVALFTDAVRIDIRKLREFDALPMRLLGIGLPLTIALGALAAFAVFPWFGFWEAALLAVILGPTDAALGEPVVTADAVPEMVRQGLNVESGLNDGLGLPALLIVASLATIDGAGDRDVGGWFGYVALQILGGPVVGIAIGRLGQWLLETGRRRGWVGSDFARLALFALPIAAYTGAALVHANGFIAAFAAGASVAMASEALRDAVEDFAGTSGQLLNSAVFFIVGAVLLPQFLHDIGGRHVLFAVFALTLQRMGPVALALIGTGLSRGTVLFLGWFGPRGMASVIYLLIVLEGYALPAIDDIAATVALTVLLSIVAHGMTAAPGARRYGRYVKSLVGRRRENEEVPGQRLPGPRRPRIEAAAE